MPLDHAQLSPEKTVLTYRLAGLGSRVLAHIIDVLIIFFTLYIVLMATSVYAVLIGEEGSKVAQGFLILFVSLFPFAYFIFFEGLWNGQTPGKKGASIRVRMSDGTPLTFTAAIGRNFLRVADIFPGTYFVGMIAMFINPKFQRIGDFVADTIVIHEGKVSTAFSIAPHRVGVHPLENLVGELRNMSDEQYYVLRRYCDRYPELAPDKQEHLTETVWKPMAKFLDIKMQDGIHPLYLAEATVMKYGRVRGLL
jgi:uncharacterized RDD family membrane protein YckC